MLEPEAMEKSVSVCVAQRCELIRRNEEFLKQEAK